MKSEIPVRGNPTQSHRGVKVLLTSICRPIGAAHGDAPSVGYEVLHGQITRAQGIFSPRSTNYTFGLDYIGANLDAPPTVLHYPSHAELVRELRQAPTFVGISFNLSLFQRMKEAVALVREHAPNAKVVLGGYPLRLRGDGDRESPAHTCKCDTPPHFIVDLATTARSDSQ